MKKVLIITYYWPPSGGSGVQRWLKFVKYLREFGWEPVVYTAENGEYPVLDPTLEKEIPKGVEVIRRPIWEPYQFYKKFIGEKKETRVVSGFLTEKKKAGIKTRIARWIRGNIFIPDARKFWIGPSINFLSEYLSKNKIDAIVSTGPPHSMHLIALGLKRKFNLPWLADFRDPWTNIDFYQELNLSSWADSKHHRLEKEVTMRADRIVVVGRTMREEYEIISGKKVNVVFNGFDESDFSNSDLHPENKQFSIVHIGMLGESRNHPALWEAISEWVTERKIEPNDFKLQMIGKVDQAAKVAIKKYSIEKFATYIDYLPHSEVTKLQSSASVLLLLINNTPNARGVITGKIFEYIAAQRPILCIGPEDGDAAAILQKSQSGITAGFENKTLIKQFLNDYYMRFKSGSLTVKSEGIQSFSRRNLAGEIAGILNEISK